MTSKCANCGLQSDDRRCLCSRLTRHKESVFNLLFMVQSTTRKPLAGAWKN